MAKKKAPPPKKAPPKPIAKKKAVKKPKPKMPTLGGGMFGGLGGTGASGMMP